MTQDGDSGRTHGTGSGKRFPDSTASGLDESQLAAQDLEALRAAVNIQTLETSLAVRTHVLDAETIERPKLRVHRAQLDLSQATAVKLSIAPLPHAARLKRLLPPAPRLKVRPALDFAQRQPVVRRALQPSDYTTDFEQRVSAALARHLGTEAQQWRTDAVFAQIPPEARGGITIDPRLRWAAFVLPAGMPVHQAQEGYFLIALSSPADQTRRLLLRL